MARRGRLFIIVRGFGRFVVSAVPTYRPLVGEGEEAEALEEITQEFVLLQANQTGGRRSAESSPEQATGHSLGRATKTCGYIHKEGIDAWILHSS